MKVSHLLLLGTLVFSSCSKHDVECDKEMEGTWKWVKTEGGIGNNIHDTPASTGKNINLTLDNGNYIIYTNAVLTSQGTYTIESRRCIHDHTNKSLINFSSDNDTDMMIERLDNTTLELSNEAFDGIESVYTKL